MDIEFHWKGIVQATIEQRRQVGKWANPYSYVDDVDLLRDKRQAFVFFLDLLVNRPTEFKALIHLFMLACNNLDLMRVNLTNRQNEAVDALVEAVGQGKPPIIHVAFKLGIAKSSASELIKRATEAKIRTLGELVHISNDYNHQQPSRAEIKAWMMAHKRECAGSGRPSIKVRGAVVNACQGHTLRNHALCWDCMQVYGKTFGDWPDWVGYKVRDIEREHRQDAIEALYRQQKASIPVDDDYFEVARAA